MDLYTSELWPEARIPYEIEANLRSAATVHAAIEQWEERTFLRFVPKTSNRTSEYPDYVSFVAGDRCSSEVGRRGGRQLIRLTGDCRMGIVLHEIGHTIGLRHEHNRPDRDDYVSIRWENIWPDAVGNFVRQTDQSTIPEQDYDYESIMHYNQVAFSRNRGQTLQPTSRYSRGPLLIGQRRMLSDGDVARVGSLYGYATTAVAS